MRPKMPKLGLGQYQLIWDQNAQIEFLAHLKSFEAKMPKLGFSR